MTKPLQNFNASFRREDNYSIKQSIHIRATSMRLALRKAELELDLLESYRENDGISWELFELIKCKQ